MTSSLNDFQIIKKLGKYESPMIIHHNQSS